MLLSVYATEYDFTDLFGNKSLGLKGNEHVQSARHNFEYFKICRTQLLFISLSVFDKSGKKVRRGWIELFLWYGWPTKGV